jgi:methylated-DNA-[protein]-cysteine S-methyltransferase
MTERRFYHVKPCPLGELLLVSDGEALVGLSIRERIEVPPSTTGWIRDEGLLGAAATQLDEYFAGTRREFDVPLNAKGTPFQESVWEALRAIPYGETVSYSEVARRIGRPRAVRAVGAANHRNAIAIVVPCHRVVGADGRLTGYAGGLWRKEFLLDLESGQLRTEPLSRVAG